MKQNKLPLPIDSAIAEILERVNNYSTVIVKASPGSGKTTRLPWAIASVLSKKVAVLEPRRLAAKMAAQRIADEQDLTLGKEVGFHFRFEKNLSSETKLSFFTEGTFLKKFQGNTGIDDFEVVILDEFHERHVETDLALALCLDLQKSRNLKIVIMSATLDVRLSDFFQNSSFIEVEGTVFPVENHFLPNQPSVLNQSLELKVKRAVESSEGDTLVFVPGMREMLKIKDTLQNYHVFLLHGDLSKEEQSIALQPSQERKIILATNIAESSLTIPGIKVVVDSGVQREAYFSPWNGLKLIRDAPITKSSAIQRAGRAGRTGPGVCFRLYSEQDYNEREEFTVPELRKADLTDIYLLIKSSSLTPHWFENPPEDKWQKSKNLLLSLGALKDDTLTELGKKLLTYPVDVRLGRALLEGEEMVYDEKEKLLNYICFELEGDKTGALKRRLNFYLKKSGNSEMNWERCILTGFIDQVAKYRSKQRDFIHFSGKTLKAHHSQKDLLDGLYLVLDITQKQEALKVLSIEEEWLWDIDPFPFNDEEEITIDPFTIKIKTQLGSIVIEEAIKKAQWNELSSGTQARVIELSQSRILVEVSAFKSGRLFEKFAFWCKTMKLDPDKIFEKINLQTFFNTYGLSFREFSLYLSSIIDVELQEVRLDLLLPDKLNLGGKRDLLIHYSQDSDPYIEAPLQDFFGLSKTPTLLNGKLQITLKLLGPHKRPIQITRDLESFWHSTYQDMKREYQRDYPRHYWPDKPWEAKPYLLKSHLPKG